ncbi:transcriptional regulator, TetR family [Methylobacillus rhizosphaerae]|uniref:Transcriptional regulator, TetR family n=1 Tax=Methylobacillus rhizosphaerae TaxID=551994 RepID=A0A238ZRH5_9PROT|nr:TetR family transcriptional regulator [Methylobacillus rhizosphaerae]SNR86007.1 transcriptional regulator, TetR family [Methylobacillus rhizosphaerae]
MARKTKENAEITRQRIITAAREVFAKRGVSRTTMEHIASHAEVTRGAIYWHFKNKIELFHAMRDQAILPLIDHIDAVALDEKSEDPLSTIEQFFTNTILTLMQDPATNQTYEIMMTKCEYVDEFAAVLQQIVTNCDYFTEKIRLLYEHAKQKDQLNAALDPAALAMDSHLFFSGLLHMWVKDTGRLGFREQALGLIKQHIALRRAC